MLPFLRDRSLFDYNTQKWVSIEWIKYTRAKNTSKGVELVTDKNESYFSITDELNPITKSKFAIFMPFVAIICGLFALVPDISHLWGNSTLDQSPLANLFFFHYAIDTYVVQNGFTASQTLTLELPLMLTTITWIVCLLAVSNEMQYNRKNYENSLY